MSIHLRVVFIFVYIFIFVLTKHPKFYDFDIRIVKKNIKFKFHVGLHRETAPTCHFSPFLQICWPTFLNFLRNVGQHFSFIFSFVSMFVPKANWTNMLVSWCWSKCWPTCCLDCARFKETSFIWSRLDCTWTVQNFIPLKLWVNEIFRYHYFWWR